MDSLFILARENCRKTAPRSEVILNLEFSHANRRLDTWNALIDYTFANHFSGMTLACNLAYADWRHPGHEWREGRAPLAAWFKETCTVSFMRKCSTHSKPPT
jgi:hypothetical protein